MNAFICYLQLPASKSLVRSMEQNCKDLTTLVESFAFSPVCISQIEIFYLVGITRKTSLNRQLSIPRNSFKIVPGFQSTFSI